MSRGSAYIKVEPAGVEPLIPRTGPRDVPSSRDILLQTLLHLPRIARSDGTVDRSAAIAEIERIRAIRIAELASLHAFAQIPALPPKLEDLELDVVNVADAKRILGTFHYLRSFREDSVTMGATYEGQIVALCSISPLDLPVVAESLPLMGREEAAVVSRVFAFDWAPRNLISYLLARVEKFCVAVRANVRLLVTYLNPNLGFSGASYRAANWLPLGLERGTRYAYFNRRYITDRQVSRLSTEERAQVKYSQMPLHPLVLLCRPLDKRLQRRYPNGFDLVFDRPSDIGREGQD